MAVTTVIRALWQMLNTRRRLIFIALVGLLFVTGTMEMGGMVVLFGFVRGLSVDADTGERSGPLALVLRLVLSRELSQVEFVALGGAGVIGFMVTKNLLGTSVRFGLNRFLMKLNQRISGQLYRSFMLAPYEVFLRKGAGGPARRIGKVFDLFNMVFGATTQVIADSFIVVMVVGLLLVVDPALTGLAAVLFGAVGVGLYSVLRRAVRRMGKDADHARSETRRQLGQGMRGVIDVRLRGSRRYFFSKYAAALGRAAVLERRKVALARLPRTANEISLAVLIVGAVVYVTVRGETVASSLPTLGVFGFAGLRMIGVLSRLNASAQLLTRKQRKFRKYVKMVRRMAPQALGDDEADVVDYLREEKPLPKGADGRLHREIRLSGVSFKYPKSDTEVLHDVSFSVPRGGFVSICGPSGSGKSTLLLLLMGMTTPTKGNVTCDDWSIYERIRRWHRNIGYVSQRAIVASGSIRENVAFGIDPAKIDDEQVWCALSLASAEKFVRELPDQLETILREAGTALSGGQLQRIMIARALYDDPDIIVLDEATAALDNVTEREITDAILGLSGKKTIICVAHRLSTIQASDVIHVLARGRIVASGSYTELLRTSDEFVRLVQAGGVDRTR